MRSVIRFLSAAIAATTLASCADLSGPSGKARSSLAIVPQFSESASLASATLAQAGLTYNAVRIVIVRPAHDTLKDTTIVFSPTSPETTLELSINAIPAEALIAAVQFKQDATVIFSGQADVKAVAPTASATATPVVVKVDYTGPGATATSVSISPNGGLYSASSSTQFTAKAFDLQNVEIPNAPIFWSVSDPTKATISSTGLLTPSGNRGTIGVTATAANGIAKTVTVELAPAPAGLRVIQGAGQQGAPGATLALPVIVELFAADGLPAAASSQTVTFSASAGAQITPTTATLDASGRAQATMRVGNSAGTTYIYTATVGTFTTSWSGSAKPGVPTHFVTNSPTTIEVDAGAQPDPIPTLRIADAAENSVAGVFLKVTVTKSGEPAKPPVQFPMDSVGVIQILKIPPADPGTYTVLIETADATLGVPSITYTVIIRPAGNKLVFTQQPPANVTAGQTITIQVTIQNQSGATITSPAPSNINLAIDPATTGWSIAGTGSVAPVNGVATFSVQILTSSGAKSGVRIQANGANLSAVLSAAFNITP